MGGQSGGKRLLCGQPLFFRPGERDVSPSLCKSQDGPPVGSRAWTGTLPALVFLCGGPHRAPRGLHRAGGRFLYRTHQPQHRRVRDVGARRSAVRASLGERTHCIVTNSSFADARKSRRTYTFVAHSRLMCAVLP